MLGNLETAAKEYAEWWTKRPPGACEAMRGFVSGQQAAPAGFHCPAGRGQPRSVEVRAGDEMSAKCIRGVAILRLPRR